MSTESVLIGLLSELLPLSLIHPYSVEWESIALYLRRSILCVAAYSFNCVALSETNIMPGY